MAKSDWDEIALGYSKQLGAYSTGISLETDRPVVGQWICLAAEGELVAVIQ